MVLQRLSCRRHVKDREVVPQYADHCLITQSVTESFENPEHFTGRKPQTWIYR
jgi:hypothetical protein